MDEEKRPTVEFTAEAVKAYLDEAIQHWRRKRDGLWDPKAGFYVDAFQSVRVSLFGELLAEDDQNAGRETDVAGCD